MSEDVQKEEAQEKKGEPIIIAPHPDDEVIGCWELLEENSAILYDASIPADRREEARGLRKFYSNCKQIFQYSVPQPLLKRINAFYFPDPIYETHPAHRRWGMMGEMMARDGYNVIFYSTLMNAPYIHEVRLPLEKLKVLHEVYHSQESLWQYDHKYYLFEGRCKWIF